MAGEFCPVTGQNSVRQSMRSRQGCPQTSEPQEDGAKIYNRMHPGVVQWSAGQKENCEGTQIVVWWIWEAKHIF